MRRFGLLYEAGDKTWTIIYNDINDPWYRWYPYQRGIVDKDQAEEIRDALEERTLRLAIAEQEKSI